MRDAGRRQRCYNRGEMLAQIVKSHHRCPECGSEAVSRSHRRRHPGDLVQVALSRYRCRKCGHRFWGVGRRTWFHVVIAAIAVVCVIGMWGLWRLYDSAGEMRRGPAIAEEALANDGTQDYELAMRLLEGRNIAKDPDRAVSLLERAAENGYVLAQYQLGLCLRDGIGVAPNDERALTWLRLAAESGEPRAEYELGQMYVGGRGTARDVVNGYAWLSLASAHGVRAADEARDSALSGLNTAQVRSAQAAARRLIDTRLNPR
jgi:predicted RNA-binding Zn-ribbon protein involved in translation (DUF1610 family)